MFISSLLYIIFNIRINIVYVIIKLACYAFNLNNIYFIIIKRIYKYLKSIKDYSITYYKNKNYFISRYYNADYISDIKTIKSISDYLILYAKGIIN
jgi:hypothetical protein